MKKVVIIGANNFQKPLIKKARELGFETHVFAWKDGAEGAEFADYFYPVSVTEKEEILQKCLEIKPDAVTTIASDLTTHTVSYVATKLSLPCNSIDCVNRSTDKYLMRSALKNAGIKTPEFAVVNENDKLDLVCENMTLPVIVKPTDRSGSRGVTKVYDINELEKAVDAAIKNSFEKKAIIEEFIEGDEYSCECISYNGKHHFLAMTKKYTTGAPSFIETGHIQPSGLGEDKEKEIAFEMFKALDALGITLGASHSEFKIGKDGSAQIIEIGARMGGDCIGSHLVELSSGFDFLKMTLDCALGKEPEIKSLKQPQAVSIQFIFSKEDLDKLDRIKKSNPEAIKEISNIDYDCSGEIVDSSTRYGHYILSCDTIKELERVMNL